METRVKTKNIQGTTALTKYIREHDLLYRHSKFQVRLFSLIGQIKNSVTRSSLQHGFEVWKFVPSLPLFQNQNGDLIGRSGVKKIKKKMRRR